MIRLIRKILAIPNLIYNFIVLTFRNVEYQKFPKISGRIFISDAGKLIIGKNLKITSSINVNPVGMTTRTMFCISKTGCITIGDNVGISNSLFYSIIGITLEDEVLVGGGCQFLDNDFHSIEYEKRTSGNDSIVPKAPITIKKGAFIGASSIIVKGVTVGEKSIVAAGSVVVKSIPPNEIWGGNPAKFIKAVGKEIYVTQ